jgi:hypothetical protein
MGVHPSSNRKGTGSSSSKVNWPIYISYRRFPTNAEPRNVWILHSRPLYKSIAWCLGTGNFPIVSTNFNWRHDLIWFDLISFFSLRFFFTFVLYPCYFVYYLYFICSFSLMTLLKRTFPYWSLGAIRTSNLGIQFLYNQYQFEIWIIITNIPIFKWA